MTEPRDRVVVFHTAFIGDIILMLPLLQILRRERPDCSITVVVGPGVADLVRKHPAVDHVIVYDKRGMDRGVGGACRLVRRLRDGHFTLALVPHRSLRSAMIIRLAEIPRRVGFTTSAAAVLFTDRVPYRSRDHEIDRNISLLAPITGTVPRRVLPEIRCGDDDESDVRALLAARGAAPADSGSTPIVALAPGSIWRTKRWPAASFAAVARGLVESGNEVVLVGSSADAELCASIVQMSGQGRGLVDCAGRTTLTGLAALLKRCRALVANDSAPVHIAMGVGTPVIALFGPTVPAIGFAPVGPHDRVLEVADLACRPCNIHGGNECPIGSFACMHGIRVSEVLNAVRELT